MLYYRTRYYTLPHIRVVLQSFNKLAMRVSSWSQSKKKKKKKKKIVVHLEFFFKSDHKILSYGHFKIIAQECPW